MQEIIEMSWALFSDLDGTLLDAHTYDFRPANRALTEVKRRGMPLILCSSKTRAEMTSWHRRLELHAPFIVENGSAVVFPPRWTPLPDGPLRSVGEWRIWELGAAHAKIVEALRSLAEGMDRRIRGLSDMTIEEIIVRTGLHAEQAQLARQREYSEPFIVVPEPPPETISEFVERVRAAGLQYTRGGRFHHLMGPTTKGQAVRRLTGLFHTQWAALHTMGLGDSPNDFSMLRAVDLPVLVKRPDGTYVVPEFPCYHAPGVGPHGWAAAVAALLQDGRLPGDWYRK
jgi:mannosyl-3-phosphoglycerate phosphatase